MNKTLTLHKYWLNVVSVKEVLFDETHLKYTNIEPQTKSEYLKRHYFHSRLSIIYALMYVVIEGFINLKLSNSRINELLEQTEYIDSLRRYRNSVFHHQKDTYSEKESSFLEAEGTAVWTKELYFAFDNFFDNLYPEENYVTYLCNN